MTIYDQAEALLGKLNKNGHFFSKKNPLKVKISSEQLDELRDKIELLNNLVILESSYVKVVYRTREYNRQVIELTTDPNCGKCYSLDSAPSQEPEKAMRFNEGKVQWSLVHFKSLEPMVRVLEAGSRKYAPFNWQKPMDRSKIMESLMRHVAAIIDGETHDPETGELHIGAIQCNALFWAYHYEREKKLAYPDGGNWDALKDAAIKIKNPTEGSKIIMDRSYACDPHDSLWWMRLKELADAKKKVSFQKFKELCEADQDSGYWMKPKSEFIEICYYQYVEDFDTKKPQGLDEAEIDLKRQ